jgi:hypothetical protein
MRDILVTPPDAGAADIERACAFGKAGGAASVDGSKLVAQTAANQALIHD